MDSTSECPFASENGKEVEQEMKSPHDVSANRNVMKSDQVEAAAETLDRHKLETKNKNSDEKARTEGQSHTKMAKEAEVCDKVRTEALDTQKVTVKVQNLQKVQGGCGDHSPMSLTDPSEVIWQNQTKDTEDASAPRPKGSQVLDGKDALSGTQRLSSSPNRNRRNSNRDAHHDCQYSRDVKESCRQPAEKWKVDNRHVERNSFIGQKSSKDHSGNAVESKAKADQAQSKRDQKDRNKLRSNEKATERSQGKSGCSSHEQETPHEPDDPFQPEGTVQERLKKTKKKEEMQCKSRSGKHPGSSPKEKSYDSLNMNSLERNWILSCSRDVCKSPGQLRDDCSKFQGESERGKHDPVNVKSMREKSVHTSKGLSVAASQKHGKRQQDRSPRDDLSHPDHCEQGKRSKSQRSTNRDGQSGYIATDHASHRKPESKTFSERDRHRRSSKDDSCQRPDTKKSRTERHSMGHSLQERSEELPEKDRPKGHLEHHDQQKPKSGASTERGRDRRKSLQRPAEKSSERLEPQCAEWERYGRHVRNQSTRSEEKQQHQPDCRNQKRSQENVRCDRYSTGQGMSWGRSHDSPGRRSTEKGHSCWTHGHGPETTKPDTNNYNESPVEIILSTDVEGAPEDDNILMMEDPDASQASHGMYSNIIL